MKHLIFVIVCIFIPFICCARVLISGSVIDSVDNTPVIGANVLIKNGEGKLLSYGSTDNYGKFTLAIDSVKTDLFIHVAMIGFKPYIGLLELNGEPIVIKMEEGALQLQEVVVKADRIRENGDTITYNVGGFAQKQDRTIGDVLKRMPGIDVADNGKIQYQGTDINKFYIEGNDLLGGKYGIATNGISHEDIGSVEVMETPQPMQVLKGLGFSDRAAINLKLKNNAKATFLAHGTLAGGWSQYPDGLLWQGDVFNMMVTGKYQMISTFKGNNTGLNLSDQLIDFTADRPDERMDGYISLAVPDTPDLQRSRSYFNRSWMVSSSHLLKTKTGGEFKAQIDYNNDRVRAKGTTTSTYFLDSGDKVVLEDKNSLSHRNALTGKFSFEVNEKTYFFNNMLSADVSWDNLALTTSGTLSNTQTLNSPEYSVSNRLKIIKRFGKNKLVTFISRNEWNSLPERLTITHDGEIYGQKIKQHSVYTDERASLGFVFNRVLLSINGGISGYFRNLDTDLWGIEIPYLNGHEQLTTDYLRVFAFPKLEWGYRKLELTLDIPVNLYSYFFSGGLRDRTEVFISPSLAVKFKLTPRMSLTLRGSARQSPAALHDIHDSSILTDYRSFTSGIDDYYSSTGQSLSVSYNYRNAQSGVFIMTMGNLGWNKSKFSTVRNIVGDYIFYSYSFGPSDTRNVLAVLNASKTLDFIRGAIGLKGNYRKVENNMLSQGINTDYTNYSYSLSPFVNGNISTFFNWDFHFTWCRALLKISDMSTKISDNFKYSGSVTMTPCPLLTWTIGGEFYRNIVDAGEYKNIFMLDTKITFNVSKRIGIDLSATNIFDVKEYRYTSYGDISMYERSNRLRGREFMISVYLKK